MSAVVVELNPEWNVEVKDKFAEVKVADEKLFVEEAKKHDITKAELEKVAKFKEA